MGTRNGGMYHRAAIFDLENSVVALNEAGTVAGGIYADSSWGGWTNNTIDGNSSLNAADIFNSESGFGYIELDGTMRVIVYSAYILLVSCAK